MAGNLPNEFHLLHVEDDRREFSNFEFMTFRQDCDLINRTIAFSKPGTPYHDKRYTTCCTVTI
jgi:hypothetical protein